MVSPAHAIYFLDRGNIDTSTTTYSNFTLTEYGSNLTLVLASGITYNTSSSDCTHASGNVTCTSGTSWVYVTNPINQPEGTTYDHIIYTNTSRVATIRQVVIENDKIANQKSQLGHGDNAYLSSNYIPAGQQYIQNLVRIWSLENYYSAEPRNGNLTCQFPTTLTRAGAWDSMTSTNNITTATQSWNSLSTKHFRAGILQVDKEFTVGEVWSFNCTSLKYNFTTNNATVQIQTNVGNHTLEARNATPLTFATEVNAKEVIYTIANPEEYDLHDVQLLFRNSENEFSKQDIPVWESGKTYVFLVPVSGQGTLYVDIWYTPEWYKNSNADRSTHQSSSVSYDEIANTGVNTPSGESYILDPLKSTEEYERSLKFTLEAEKDVTDLLSIVNTDTKNIFVELAIVKTNEFPIDIEFSFVQEQKRVDKLSFWLQSKDLSNEYKKDIPYEIKVGAGVPDGEYTAMFILKTENDEKTIPVKIDVNSQVKVVKMTKSFADREFKPIGEGICLQKLDGENTDQCAKRITLAFTGSQALFWGGLAFLLVLTSISWLPTRKKKEGIE